MKKAFVFGLLAVLPIIGCQDEKELFNPNNNNEQEPAKVFTAIVDDDFGKETKSSLNDSGNVLWKLGDQVSIFAANTVNEQYQVADDSDGKTAATLNKIPTGSFVAGTEIDNNVAFYPYASTAQLAKSGDDYVISDIELPATQTYAAGSFGNGAFPMTAVTSTTDDLNLKFKNVLGGLKLQLKGTATITSITVTGNNNEILCGDAEVTTTYGGVPSISLSDATAKTVTLDCGAGVSLDTETATSFVIAIPPMTMTGGFTIDIYDIVGGHQQVSSTRSQTIVRSNLLVMPAINYEGVIPPPPFGYVDLGLPSGIMWANMNLGASSPEEYGDYYAWGEVETKDSYTWTNYKYGNYWAKSLNKYNDLASYGIVDNLTVLESIDDAAHVTLGGNWRIPTLDDGKELLNNCTWEVTTYNNVAGYMATSKINGNSIFFPFAGFFEYALAGSEVGLIGRYWLNSVHTTDCREAYRLSLRSPGFSSLRDVDWYDRNAGLSIRPVYGFTPTGLTLDQTSIELQPGGSYNLVPTITPSDASFQTISWSSSNTSVATIDNGVVTAVSLGTANITARLGEYCSAVCTVKVAEPVDDSFNTNSYIVYRANKTVSTGAYDEDYIAIESSFPGFNNAAVVEMKFQLGVPADPSKDPIITIGSGNTFRDSYDKLYINVNTGELRWLNYNDEYFNINLTSKHIQYTDAMVLRFSANDRTFSINNQSVSCNMSFMCLPYLFAEYSRERDEGLYERMKGVPDGSKLYYVKAYDSNGTLIYLGYATKALNNNTGRKEFCWYSHDGIKATYTFANDSESQGAFGGQIVE